MKKYLLLVSGLMLVVMQSKIAAQTEPTSPGFSEKPTVPNEIQSALPQVGGEQFVSEIEPAESILSEEPFDAFLAESGYIVYPIEENCAVLQAKISKNPMVLHKEFIARRVKVLRRVDCRSSDGSVKGVLGKQFMIVSEIGSVSQFMVDLKDLHFVQDKDDALDNPK
jgi:hypothetical protein